MKLLVKIAAFEKKQKIEKENKDLEKLDGENDKEIFRLPIKDQSYLRNFIYTPKDKFGDIQDFSEFIDQVEFAMFELLEGISQGIVGAEDQNTYFKQNQYLKKRYGVDISSFFQGIVKDSTGVE